MATTQQLSAVPRNSSGTAITGKTATWSSSNTAVATVNTTGLVTAVAPGSANITATVDGISGNSICSVAAPSSPSYLLFTFTPRSTVQQGQSVVFSGTVTRQNGYTGAVTITAPTNVPNVTVTVGAATNSLGSSVTIPNGVSQFFVSLAPSGSAAVGTTPVNLTSTGTGGLTSNLILQLDVTASAAPSIDGAFAPTSLNVTRGSSANTTLTIFRNGGYTGSVVPSVDSSTLRGAFPFDNPGTVTFSPAVLTAGVTSCTMTISLPAGWTSGPNDPNFVQVKITGDGVAEKVLQAVVFVPQG